MRRGDDELKRHVDEALEKLIDEEGRRTGLSRLSRSLVSAV